MYAPTHTTLEHLRAVLHVRRALAWSNVLPVSRILAPAPRAVTVHIGRAY